MKLFDRDAKKGSISLKLFFVAFLLLWSISPMKRPGSDDLIYWDTAYNVVTRGSLALGYNAKGYVVRNPNGKYYSKYGVGWSLALIPAAGLYRVVDIQELDMGVKEAYERLIFTLTPAAAGAGTVVLLFGLLIMLGIGRKWAVFFALAGVFATPLLVYDRGLYSEAFQAFLFTLFLWSAVALEQKKRLIYAVILGIAIGWAMLTKVTNGALLIAGLTWVWWLSGKSERGRVYIAVVLSFMPFAAILLWYNMLRVNSLLQVSYGFYVVPQWFFTPWYYGIFGDILSPGRGLLWYMPLVALLPRGLAVLRQKAGLRYVLLIGTIALFYLVLYALWSPWHGAEQWGPRFLVPLTGLLTIPIAFSIYRLKFKKTVVITLAALGLLVNILGVAISYSDYYAQIPYKPYSSVPIGLDGKPTQHPPLDNLYMASFVPSFSPIAGHLWLLKHAITGDPQLSKDPPWKWLGYKAFNRRVKDRPVQPNLWFCIDRTEFGNILSIIMAIFFILMSIASGWEIRKTLEEPQ